MASKHLRLARLIEMIHLISNSRSWNAKRFAEYFEISEKRIYDDIAELNAAKIPIVFDNKHGGYTFLNQTNIPTSNLLASMDSTVDMHQDNILC